MLNLIQILQRAQRSVVQSLIDNNTLRSKKDQHYFALLFCRRVNLAWVHLVKYFSKSPNN